MPGMAGKVRTISPRVSIGDLERQVRAAIDQEGSYVGAATTTDARQVAHLWRLTRRLEADPGLDCFPRPRPDGSTVLSVIRRGEQPGGYWGEAKTG